MDTLLNTTRAVTGASLPAPVVGATFGANKSRYLLFQTPGQLLERVSNASVAGAVVVDGRGMTLAQRRFGLLLPLTLAYFAFGYFCI